MLKPPPDLQADCSRCAALCCQAPAFDAVQGFGFDKPAHCACPNLLPDHRCGIHAELSARGFPGCVAYDCHGAGQWVTEHFGHLPQAELWEQFLRLRPLHALLMLLTLAEPRAPQLAALRAELAAVRAKEEQGRAVFDAQAWTPRVHAALRSLATSSPWR
jgi:hypothetical protein